MGDEVKRRGLELAMCQVGPLGKAVELCAQLTVAIEGCGFDDEVTNHLNMKLLDIVTHLSYRHTLIKVRINGNA